MIDYLPIGSVVILKNGEKPLMVMGYKVSSIDNRAIKDNKLIETNDEFDYCGVLYPEGVISSNINCLFNHSDIKEVLFKGYDTDEFKKLFDFLNSREG